jgi:hypothetical protein
MIQSIDRNAGCTSYFQHLNRVFAFLIAWYKKLIEGGNTEARIVEIFLEKFLFTIGLLQFKHLGKKDDSMPLSLDKSGFPHWSNIFQIATDLTLKEERLGTLPSRRIVMEMMLDEMLSGNSPTGTLPQMANIHFWEELDEERIISGFTPGKVVRVENETGEAGVINCLFPWLCYDRTQNVPCIYVMAFDFKGNEECLRRDVAGDFLPTINRFGDRITPLAVMAADIDNALPRVFPKIIKRVLLGPIISVKFSTTGDHDDIVSWLAEFGSPDDFALLIETSVLFSQGECDRRGGWLSFGSKRVRQIFAIMDCENQASQVKGVILLPHEVFQQIESKPEFEQKYGSSSKLTYGRQGGIYVV